MPEFTNPFSGVVPGRKLTDSELARALRLNLAAEEEAVHLYQAHADATDNELAKRVLLDIADEERVHAGEFQRLLDILLKDEEGFLAEGAEEVNQMAEGSSTVAQAETTESKAAGRIPTVGNLKQ
jgi:rubrerythrin